jgi:hypothetical protein
LIKKIVALISLLAYAIYVAVAFSNPGPVDIPLMFLSGGFVAVLVLVLTNKRKEEK